MERLYRRRDANYKTPVADNLQLELAIQCFRPNRVVTTIICCLVRKQAVTQLQAQQVAKTSRRAATGL